jgi:hypothetical protein
MHLCIPRLLRTCCMVQINTRHSREMKVTIDACGMSPSTRTRLVHSGHNRYSKFQHDGDGHRFQRGRLALDRMLMLE